MAAPKAAILASPDFPWAGALVQSVQVGQPLTPYDGYKGGATIVHPYWALTAGHCIPHGLVDDDGTWRPSSGRTAFAVVMGGRLARSDNDDPGPVSVVEIYRHDGYRDETLVNDLALLRLARPQRRPLRIATAYPSSGTRAYTWGWGASFQGDTWSEQLHATSVVVRPKRVCDQQAFDSATHHLKGDSRHMVCAGGSTRAGAGRGGLFEGDSGGALMVRGPGATWSLVGVASWTARHGGENVDVPGVYAYVPAHAGWIAKTIRADSSGR